MKHVQINYEHQKKDNPFIMEKVLTVCVPLFFRNMYGIVIIYTFRYQLNLVQVFRIQPCDKSN